MIRRLVAFIDRHVNRNLGLHLARAGVASSPQERLRLHLAPSPMERAGAHPCCQCCPRLCVDIHRDPCDQHQTGGVA